MKQRRLEQLSAMYAEIMGVPLEEARAVIVSTPSGQEIARDNPAYLYEQQTANLYDIACELPQEIRAQLTDDKLEAAARSLSRAVPMKKIVVKAADPDKRIRLRKAYARARQKDLLERAHRGLQIQKKEKMRHDTENKGQPGKE